MPAAAELCRRLLTGVFVTAADSSLQQAHAAPGPLGGPWREAPPPTPQPGGETLVPHHHTLAAGTVRTATNRTENSQTLESVRTMQFTLTFHV